MSEQTIQQQRAVLAGQVWADRDKRRRGRQIEVLVIEGDTALVQTVVPSPGCPVGQKRRVRLDRFKPTHNGYDFVR